MFDEQVAKIYAAEIINVLETLHTNNVMHRDLKPENILLTQDYHLKVVSNYCGCFNLQIYQKI